jgi:hypothetical protein
VRVSPDVKQSGPGFSIAARALECAIIAAVALLAADMIRTALRPFWQTLRLLLGI